MAAFLSSSTDSAGNGSALFGGNCSSERPARGSERRQTSRLPCRLSAMCREEGQTEGIRARVVDVSVGGLCLMVGREFPSGTPLLVELREPTGAIFGSVRCLVAHISQGPNGLWRLGCTVTEGDILPD